MNKVDDIRIFGEQISAIKTLTSIGFKLAGVKAVAATKSLPESYLFSLVDSEKNDQ